MKHFRKTISYEKQMKEYASFYDRRWLSSRVRKDLRRSRKRGKKLDAIIERLKNGEKIDKRLKGLKKLKGT